MHLPAPIQRLLDEWKTEEQLLRRRGLSSEADALSSYAADVTDSWLQWLTEELTLEQASAETGLSYSSLQKKVRSGVVANAGRKGRPRVQRSDLMRAADRTGAFKMSEPDLVRLVLEKRST